MTNGSTTEFSVSTDVDPASTLVVGVAEMGLAGLTAVDYVVDQLDLAETGHVKATETRSIVPFQGGTPRHHTRLFGGSDQDVTFLLGELFVPPETAARFAQEVLDWAAGHDVEEVVVLSGVPFPHGPDEHRTFYVATEDYRKRRLDDAEVPPMGRGFLEGVSGAILERGLDSDLRTGVFVTPVHAQAPDADAALRLLETTLPLYDLPVDTGPLRAFAEEIGQYYADLESRMKEVREESPADRMYN